jgi:hypothetical protein
MNDEEEQEYMRRQRQTKVSANKNNIDFNDVLKQWGVNDLNKLIGGVTSESDTERVKKQQKARQKTAAVEEQKQQSSAASKNEEKSAQNRVSMIQQIMEENRKAQMAR